MMMMTGDVLTLNVTNDWIRGDETIWRQGGAHQLIDRGQADVTSLRIERRMTADGGGGEGDAGVTGRRVVVAGTVQRVVLLAQVRQRFRRTATR